jgi:hypothetical protein
MATTDALQDTDPRDVEAPRGRTSLLTMVLIVLNIAGLAAFAWLMYMDMLRQEKWARAVYLRHLALVGLPVDETEKLGASDTNPERAVEMMHSLDPPEIQAAYKKRGITPKGKFIDVKEVLSHNIRYPVEPDVLAEYFKDANKEGSVGKAVGSLKEELAFVKGKLPGDIDRVADEVAKKLADKDDKDKRQLVRDVLFPTAVEGWQIGKLELKLRAASGKELDNLIVEAAKRKMLYDILKPMEIFRPSEPDTDLYVDAKLSPSEREVKKPLLDRVTDLEGLPTSKLLELLDKRFDDVIAGTDWIDPGRKRDIAEKRRAITFLLLAISQVEVPGNLPAEAPKKDAGDKKDPKQPDDKKDKDDKDQGMVKFVDQDDPKKDGDDPKKDKDEPKKDKESEGEKPKKERPPRTFAFPETQLRVEVVCGMHNFNQACTDLTIVIDLMHKHLREAIVRDRGEYVFPIGGRVHDPTQFTEQLLKVMKSLRGSYTVWEKIEEGEQVKDGTPIKEENKIRYKKVMKELKLNFVREDEFKQDLEKRLKDVQGKVRSGEEVLKIVYDAMQQRVFLLESPEDTKYNNDLKQNPDKDKFPIEPMRAQFETHVIAVLNANADGFMTKHQAAIKRIQELAMQIEVRKRQYKELDKNYKEREFHIETRKTHEKEILDKLLKARAKTQALAKDLQRLQQQLFLAQVDLIGAHDYNIYLEQYLSDFERKMVKGKGGKGK